MPEQTGEVTRQIFSLIKLTRAGFKNNCIHFGFLCIFVSLHFPKGRIREEDEIAIYSGTTLSEELYIPVTIFLLY
jgi:hypothetical protein